MTVLLTAVLLAAAPAPPTGPELAAAEADVREVFGRELKAADTDRERVALAEKLIETAGGSRPAAKYALLQKARELAIAAGDSTLGIRAVEGLVEGFGAESPQDAAQWAAEGHRVWNVAGDQRPADRLRGRLEAAECYLRALEGLAGFQRAAVENRLRELATLSPRKVKESFALDWPEKDKAIKGEVGNIEDLGSRVLLTEPLVARTLDFSFTLKAPAYHCLAVEIDGALYWFSRGHWQNTGLLVGCGNRTLTRKRPGPSVETPDEWHTLRATVSEGWLEMRYDSDSCWRGQLPGPGPYRMRPGFGGHRSTIEVKDVVLTTAPWAAKSTQSN